MKKIAVLTSGGDCGGLNAVVKGAALMANQKGAKCYVIPNGYAGLYNLVDFDHLVELTPERLDKIDLNLAGSEAGHSRVKIRKIEDEKKYERIKAGLKKFGIEGMVISGGDDSGSVMVDLAAEGIKCVHAPKTMDLDLQSYSVGADSTISRIAAFVEDLKTTAYTHNRIFAVEVFGRYAGHTAFRGGVAADADAVLIPEVPVDFDALYEHCKQRFMWRVKNSDVKAGSYLIVVAEGLKNANGEELVDENAPADSFGHKRLAGSGSYVAQQLGKRFKADPSIKEFMVKNGLYVKAANEAPEVRAVVPSHLVRCGHTSPMDANFGKEVGSGATLLLLGGLSSVTVVGVTGQEVKYMPTAEAIKQRHVDPALIAYHEQLGMSFGRKPENVKVDFKKVEGKIERPL
jgi:6-phosphofructokinase 1